jgi:serine protease Do
VLAIGNPFGIGQTVTSGIVSATGRSGDLGLDYEDFIQTDAAINPGNSGGALVDMQGRLIGLNTAILSRSGGFQGIGFAIPSNLARHIMDSLVTGGRVVRGFLGVTITNVDQKAEESFKLPSREGALVESVSKDGPADKGDVRAGDVIVAIGGTSIKETRQLIDRVSAIAPGQKVDLEIIRDGKRLTVPVVLGERPGTEGEQETSTAKEDTPSSKLGLEVDELSARTRRQFDLPKDVEGVVITDVTELSPADDAGLRAGDIVMRVNARDVASQKDFREAIAGVRSGSMVRLYVYRAQAEQKSFVFVRMP